MKQRMIRLSALLGGGALLGVAYLLLLLYTPFEGIPCLFRETTGLLCPACGLTHALTDLFCGHPLSALSHLPILPVYLLWGGWVTVSAARRYLRGQRCFAIGPLWIHLLVGAAVLIFWVLRNL